MDERQPTQSGANFSATETNNSSPSVAMRVADAVLAQISSGNIDAALDIHGRPCLRFRDDVRAEYLGLDDERVACRLTWLAHQTTGELPNDRQLRQVLRAIGGFAICAQRPQRLSDPAALKAIEDDPLVAVIVEFMSYDQRDRVETNVEPLFKELKKFAKANSLRTIGKRHFPGAPNVLSRRLKEVSHILAHLGVNVLWPKRSNGQAVILEQVANVDPDGSMIQPSIQPSEHTPITTLDLGRNDDIERLVDDACSELPDLRTIPSSKGVDNERTP